MSWRGIDGHGLASVSTASIPDPVGVTDGIVDHLASRPAGLLVVGGGRHKAFALALCAISSAPCRCRWSSSTDETDDVMA
jgi:hypothetical protein